MRQHNQQPDNAGDERERGAGGAGGSGGSGGRSGGLVIIGGGGHAKVVAEAALAAGLRLTGFLDDNHAAALARHAQRIGALAMLDHPEATRHHRFIIGLGDLALRAMVIPLVPEDAAATIIHPRAYISPTARIGNGVYIGPGAIIHADATIADHAIINSGAIIEHDCTIGANSHIAPGATLGGEVAVGEGTLVGLGARVLPGVTIGSRCVVGAGSVVVREVGEGELVVGAPARLR